VGPGYGCRRYYLRVDALVKALLSALLYSIDDPLATSLLRTISSNAAFMLLAAKIEHTRGEQSWLNELSSGDEYHFSPVPVESPKQVVLLNDRRLVSNPAGPVCTLAAPHDATAKEAVGIKHYPA